MNVTQLLDVIAPYRRLGGYLRFSDFPLRFHVKVLDARESWGRVQLLVSDDNNTTTWVDKERVDPCV